MNNYTKLAAATIMAMLTLQAHGQVMDWENPAVLGINKLPYHATLQLPSKQKECKEIVSLDGQWLFHWSRKPEERPADFYREDYDVSGWDKITVPGNWQMQGEGRPQYNNMSYPIPPMPPLVPDENTTGCFFKTFQLFDEWKKRRIILSFGGVDSYFECWINGKFCGMGKVSHLTSEYDTWSRWRSSSVMATATPGES